MILFHNVSWYLVICKIVEEFNFSNISLIGWKIICCIYIEITIIIYVIWYFNWQKCYAHGVPKRFAFTHSGRHSCSYIFFTQHFYFLCHVNLKSSFSALNAVGWVTVWDLACESSAATIPRSWLFWDSNNRQHLWCCHHVTAIAGVYPALFDECRTAPGSCQPLMVHLNRLL